MMTCSMPAATASSTAYWMIGLSTRGSISFGCALVAGRKRVPQPAAGKTALRTRIEPRGDGVGLAPEVYLRASVTPPSRADEGPCELANGAAEGARTVEVREVHGTAQHDSAGVDRRCREGGRRQPEQQVELPVDEQDRPAEPGQLRDESLGRQRPQG